MPFISSCLTAVAKTSSTMLNKNGASGSPMGGEEHQSGSWVSGGMDPAPKPKNSGRDIPKSSQASTAWLRQLTPQQSKSPAGLCYRESRCGAIAFPWLMLQGRECSTQEKWHHGVGEWLSTGILAAVPSARSPGHNPGLCQRTLFWSALFLQSPAWVATNKIYALALQEGACLSSRLQSLPEDRIPDFQSDVMWVCLPGSALRLPSSQEEPLRQLRSLSRISTLWEWGQPFPHLCLSYQPWCGFFYKSLAIRLFS